MAQTSRKGWAAGVLGVIMLLTGCATKKSNQVREEFTGPVPSMQTTRQQLVEAQKQVDEVLASMERLRSASAANLPQTYQDFTNHVAQTVSQADLAARRAGQMQYQVQGYIAGWGEETTPPSGPQSRAEAAERRQVVQQNYIQLQDAARAVGAAYPPLLAQLRDIQSTLSANLTLAGVKAARPAFTVAHETATNLKRQITGFIAQIDLAQAASPAKERAGGVG